MGFKAIVCEACGDTAHPDYVCRRMIGMVGSIMIHDDCCQQIYEGLIALGGGDDPLTRRFKIHGPHWPSTHGPSKEN